MKTFFAEFFYSALLWGSLITALLWWLRTKAKSRVARGLLFLPFWWFALHTAIAWYGFVVPPSGRLIDADSGEPIKNTRVIVTWKSYPMAIWTTFCTGRQAHLTNEDGDFTFRFSPYPTLVFGSLFRGLNPKVPGRIRHSENAILPAPIWGDVPIARYAPGRMITGGGPNTECKVDISPQFVYDFSMLPGEEHPFNVMYREACIEQKPDSFTNQYMHDLMSSSADISGYRRSEADRDNPQWIVAQQILSQIGSMGCPGVGGLCASAISVDVHEEVCEYVMWRSQVK